MNAFDALGNPLRRDILWELRGGTRSVGQLADRFPVSRPAVSRHLRILQDAGLVEPRTLPRTGKPGYALRAQGFKDVRAFLDGFWEAALARLEEVSRE